MPATVTDLAEFLDAEDDGVHWTLAGSDDLNANLVRLGPDRSMAEHRNEDVDVLVIVMAGSARLVVDDEDRLVAPGVLALVPRGATRAIHAGADGLAYITVHRRRGPLGIRASGRRARG
jgi:quercetin dioxygenase-like cupin family protein